MKLFLVVILCLAVNLSLCGEFALLKEPIHEDITKQAVKLAGMFLRPAKSEGPVTDASSIDEGQLIHGVRWNDLPDSRVLTGATDGNMFDNLGGLVWNLKFAPIPIRGLHKKEPGMKKDYDMNKVPLAQRSHYFDLQHFHSMTPCALVDSIKDSNDYVNYRCKSYTNAQVLELILSQASEWFTKACLNKVAELEFDKSPASQPFPFRRAAAEARVAVVHKTGFKAAWERVKQAVRRFASISPTTVSVGVARGVETGEFYLGNLLHLVEDSYSGAHCARSMGLSGRLQEGPILFFQDYSAQAGAKHEKSDVPSCYSEFNDYWMCRPIDLRKLSLEREESYIISGADDTEEDEAATEYMTKNFTPEQRRCRQDRLRKLNECYAKSIGLELEGTSNKKSLTAAGKSKLFRSALTFKGAAILGANNARRAFFDLLLEDEDESQAESHARKEARGAAPEWGAAPGALAASVAASHVLRLYKSALVQAQAGGGLQSCEKGATAATEYLKDVVFQLADPDAVAGGSRAEYAGAQCPDMGKIAANIEGYTKWDASAYAWLKQGIFNNVLFQSIRASWRRATNRDMEKSNLDSVELTCVVPCKPVAGEKRVSPACVWWNERNGAYETKCCIDIPDSLKFNQAFVEGRNSRSLDATTIFRACDGFGTDDIEIARILFRRSYDDIKEIDGWYTKYYKKSLWDSVEDESSGTMQFMYKNVIQKRREEGTDPVADAKKILNATKGFFKVDVSDIAAILSRRTPSYNRAVAKAFATLPENSAKMQLLPFLKSFQTVSELEYKSFVLLCQDYLPSTPGSYRNALLEVDGFSADNSSRDLPQRDSVVQNDLRRLERDLDALKRL